MVIDSECPSVRIEAECGEFLNLAIVAGAFKPELATVAQGRRGGELDQSMPDVVERLSKGTIALLDLTTILLYYKRVKDHKYGH
jgi:hypothetical protein